MHCKYLPVVPYKALENFSKALYGTTGGTYSACIIRPVMQENITFRGLFIDPIPNSPNSHNKNCMAEIKGNYQSDLDSEGVSLEISWLKLFSLDYPLRTLNNY